MLFIAVQCSPDKSLKLASNVVEIFYILLETIRQRAFAMRFNCGVRYCHEILLTGLSIPSAHGSLYVRGNRTR